MVYIQTSKKDWEKFMVCEVRRTFTEFVSLMGDTLYIL